MERLIQYTARGAVSLERLTQDANGDLVYTFTYPWSDGTTGVRLSPMELLEKRAASPDSPGAVARVLAAEPDYMVMGMSSETFWGGVEGNRHFIQQIKELSHGLGVATGAEACERALQL